MDRFKILKGVDPFANKSSGDTHIYKFMGIKFIGWKIDKNSLLLEMNENSLKYISALKNAEIEIGSMVDGKKEIFQVERRIINTPYKESKRKGKVNVHLVGKITKILLPGKIVHL